MGTPTPEDREDRSVGNRFLMVLIRNEGRSQNPAEAFSPRPGRDSGPAEWVFFREES